MIMEREVTAEPNMSDMMLPLGEQVTNQVHIKPEIPCRIGKILDGYKEWAPDVHMRHEASICI